MKENIKKNWFYIPIFFVVIVLILLFPTEREEQVDVTSGSTIIETADEFIYVDIKGEIKNPGVYKLEGNSRLYQVIELAGGLTNEANILAINMASLLKDEMNIYIPSIHDVIESIHEEEIDEAGLIDINQANKNLLETLPGIGPSTAEAIIAYREEEGYFDSLEDIMNVPGIGEATFENIKDLITVS